MTAAPPSSPSSAPKSSVERPRRNWLSRVVAVLLLAIGTWLALGGGYLITLKGSPYYLVTGLLVLVSAVLIWRSDRRGMRVFGAMLALTVIWALFVSGLSFWALLPRLTGPFVIWLVLLTPWAQKGLDRPATSGGRILSRVGMAAIPAILIVAGLVSFGEVEHGPLPGSTGLVDRLASQMPDGDWENYGRSTGGTRFSPLGSITPANVEQLQVAWTYRFGELPPAPVPSLEVTPLKVGNTLYACRADMRVVALDAETGKQKWRFDPRTNTEGLLALTCRGVSYYRDPAATTGSECASRILAGTADARLFAIDAATGRPCSGFGKGGFVNLKVGMGLNALSYYMVTSPPAIVRGKAVVGGFVLDNQMVHEPSGVVRAFDAKTGQLAWAWDLGRVNPNAQLKPGETYTPGTPNAWAPMSVDEQLGMVYLPTGNATPDFWNSHRTPEMNRYASSVVALDAATGAVRWSFQTVRQDVWDYDVASQPTLLDFPVNGKTVPALLQPTKRGQTFLLDRRTGKPLKAVTERAVPHLGMQDLNLSPTQPYSTRLPSLSGADLTESSMWGLTPLDELWCRITFTSTRYQGQFTPPGLDQFLQYPGYAGGTNWGGASIDPDRLIAVVNVTHLAQRGRLVTRNEAERRGFKPFAGLKPNGPQGEAAMSKPQVGTPYAMDFNPFLSPLGIPCQQPPFGTIAAIDLRAGKLLWSRPLGSARDSGPMGLQSHIPLPLGTPNLGGSVITRSGLVFIGATQERVLRAFELATGKLLWTAKLPFAGNATPMLYRAQSGREFVVIAAAGNINLNTPNGDYLIGFALPNTRNGGRQP